MLIIYPTTDKLYDSQLKKTKQTKKAHDSMAWILILWQVSQHSDVL